jgi:hypothetical protein
MKILTILVLLTMTSMVPAFLTSAIAQQEIDPDHFDQTAPAKAVRPAPKPQASPRSAAANDRRKSTGGRAASTSRATAGSRQAKEENQLIAAAHTVR